MCAFLRCPDDLTVILWFFGIALAACLLIWVKSRNKILTIVVSSLLLNLVFFLASISGSLLFRIYNIEWFQYFALFIWPIINVILIIWYVKRKNR